MNDIYSSFFMMPSSHHREEGQISMQVHTEK